ncbi:MAG: trypsin-like peptidase domain-containing protein, partial [Pseudomonadales bacterium]|nr:trypsin-like peptidase domain-containing protein [Pseudomonadales bacterium]
TSKRYDLAYLYISDSGCVPLEPLMDRDLPLAHKVFTIGNPAGMKYTVTSGIVSGYHEHKDVEYIQTDAAINPGNSGGPLIDEEGRLLGVNSMILLDTEGIGFALPAALVVEDYQENREYIEKLLETHEFKHWMSSISSYMSDEENQELEQQIDLAAANCAKEFEDEQWGVALEECQFAADYEHAHSQYLLAKLYFERDDDVREDIAIGLLEKAALNGSAEALYLLAGFRRDGEFVEKNIELSTEMYSESCEKLFYKSCEQLAYYYRKRHDWDNVRKYLEKAIDSGSVVAYYSLGLLYRLGYGVEIDKEKSFELNRKAAMLGANRAQHFIAWQYYEGNGVDKKYQEAYKWLVVSEVDEQDYYDDWDTDVPGNLRFYLYNMLSDRERQDQVEKARVLIEEITANLEAHKSKYSHFASEIPDIAAVEKSKEANSQEDEATVEKMEEKNQPGSDAPPESDDSADKDKIEVL